MPRPSGIEAEPAPGEVLRPGAVDPAAGDAATSPAVGRVQPGRDPAAWWSSRRRSARAARRPALGDLEVDAEQHVDAFVGGAHVDSPRSSLEQVHPPRACHVPPAPRYAARTASSVWISAAVPVRDDPAEVEHVHRRRTLASRGAHRARPAPPRPLPPRARAGASANCIGLLSSWPDAGSSSRSTCGCVASAPAELDEAALAGRQRVDPCVGDGAEADALDDRVDHRRGVVPSRDQPLRMSAATRMFSRTLEQAEQLEPLERAGQARAAPAWCGLRP